MDNRIKSLDSTEINITKYAPPYSCSFDIYLADICLADICSFEDCPTEGLLR